MYNLYTGTVFAGCGLSPGQVGSLVRGVGKGESSPTLAEEVGGCRSTVPLLRQKVQAKGYPLVAQGALPEAETETDEMFQNAGEKRAAPRRSHRSATPPGHQAQGARH